ncbi:hypothetical protein ACOMHN_056887 [Nucella lapillus]
MVVSVCPTPSALWFRHRCQRLASAAQTTEAALVVMATFVRACGVTQGKDLTGVYRAACDLNPNPPSWLQQRCANCFFGSPSSSPSNLSSSSSSPSPSSNVSCWCLRGFWGPGCRHECPGGAHNPCHGHGRCADNGRCWCDRHWTGVACHVCSQGWTGQDCVVGLNFTAPTPPSSPHAIAQLSTLARVTTFDGVTFDIIKDGVYTLIHRADLGVTLAVKVTPCPAGLFSSHCVVSAILGVGSQSMEVNHRSFSQNTVTLFGGKSRLEVRGILTVGGLTLVYTSFSVLVISPVDLSMNITLTVVNSHLMVTVTTRKDVWVGGGGGMSGLVASCNTALGVRFSACVNHSHLLCNDSQVSHLPSACDRRLSLPALFTFLTIHRYVAPSTVTPAGSIVTEACLRLNNSGMVVRGLSLPGHHFSLEFHVKLLSLGGVMVSYSLNPHTVFILGCSGPQLVVITAQGRQATGLQVTVNAWTQILVSWHAALTSVEIYVTGSDGRVSFKSVRLSAGVFASGGDLTFGLPPAGVSVGTDVGVFRGLVDEVRVWARPTNPSVVQRTWKMSVQEATPDLHLHWPLNDGVGLAAKERRRRSTMYAADVNNPPTWEISDLTLVSMDTQDLGDFEATDTTLVKPTTNATSLAVAEATCAALVGDVTSSPDCRGVFPDGSAVQQQCSVMVRSTGSSEGAQVLALALAQLCQQWRQLHASPLQAQCHRLAHLTSVLPYYGPQCSRTCLFGLTPALASCRCYHGYWGSACSELCPFTTRGVCHAVGVCSPILRLHALHCGVEGGDCSVTVTVVKVSISWRSAVVFGSYLTTWDGASVAVVTPGTYRLLQVKGVDVVALFLPCPQYRRCRLISALSITVDTFHLKATVSGDRSDNFTFTVRVQGQLEVMTFPVSKSWGGVSVTWWKRGYVRVAVDSKVVMVIGASPVGLVLATKLHRNWFAHASGMLGTPDGSHLNDLLPSSSASDADLTGVKVSQHQRDTFFLTGNHLSALLAEDVAGHNLTSGGHMLRLTHQSLTFTSLSVVITTQQLTLTLWVRVEAVFSTSTVILKLATSVGEVSVWVHQRDIVVTWLGGERAVLTPVSVSEWTYLAVTWDDSVASLTVFAIQESGMDYRTITVNRLSADEFTVTQLTLTGPQTNQTTVEIDLFRLWQSAKSLKSIAEDLRVYSSDPELDRRTATPVLRLCAGFDEGEGNSSKLWVWSAALPLKVSGEITAGGVAAPPVWRPSTIPVLDVALPENVFRTPYTNQSSAACLRALQDTGLQQHCRDLHALSSLYLDACVRELQRTGHAGVPRTVVDMLAFVCHTIKDVGECELDGYIDFCRPIDEEFPDWIIIVICISILILVSCCCCFIAFIIAKKKKKRKQERNLGGSVSRLSSAESETTFIREGSADIDLVQPDVGFVNPVFAHPALPSALPAATADRRKHADSAKPKVEKPKKGKGRFHTKKTTVVGMAPVSTSDGRDSSSSERPHSGFDDRPHMEAWTSSSQQRQRDQLTKQFPADPSAPVGFYTSQDEAETAIDSPEGRRERGEQTKGAQLPLATFLPAGGRGKQGEAKDDMYRMQSVTDQEKIVLDELEIEEPAPIVYRHQDDDLFAPASSRRSSSRDTMDNIKLAFED